jgi:hypothetical protein
MTTEQLALTSFIKKIDDAISELGDSIKSDLMSDSKSAVYDVERAGEALPLPPAILSNICSMTMAAWSSVVGSGDVYQRASRTIAELGKSRRHIEDLLRNGQ